MTRRVALSEVTLAVALVLLIVPVPAATGIAVGGALYWWLVARQLRAHERATGNRYVHEPRYRWSGTDGRRWGRGLFDPADIYYR